MEKKNVLIAPFLSFSFIAAKKVDTGSVEHLMTRTRNLSAKIDRLIRHASIISLPSLWLPFPALALNVLSFSPQLLTENKPKNIQGDECW